MDKTVRFKEDGCCAACKHLKEDNHRCEYVGYTSCATLFHWRKITEEKCKASCATCGRCPDYEYSYERKYNAKIVCAGAKKSTLRSWRNRKSTVHTFEVEAPKVDAPVVDRTPTGEGLTFSGGTNR